MHAKLFLFAATSIFLSGCLGESEEIIKGTEKIRYHDLAFSPDNNQVLAIPEREKRNGGSGEVYRLHVFDRKKKTKLTLFESGSDWPLSQ